ncbi:MAG: PRD domain-containing protein [Eubacteriales bacterium]|nr:PRD domain-containing protein [Eubacteriales bacterium]
MDRFFIKCATSFYNRRYFFFTKFEGSTVRIVKPLNHNMVLVRNDDGSDMILQGKGIGFKRRAGDEVDESLVERKFMPSDKSESRYFQQLFSQIPDGYFAIAEQVLEYARKELKIKVTDKVILPICDHMAGSVERCQKNIHLTHPILWDIKRIYPAEFEAGLYALELLKKQYGAGLMEDEAAFLAYHFVSAELENVSEVSVDEVTVLISTILQIVQEAFQIELSREDWNYQRFLTHLRFFANRVLLRNLYEESEDNELYEELSEHYPNINKCVDLIADYILIHYHYDISSDERLYLLIHIERVTKRYRKNK